ncbi:MAG: sulfatase, partial [Myxococcales bacterium]|nr:sulfatase [Myxococcales bacterium]
MTRARPAAPSAVVRTAVAAAVALALALACDARSDAGAAARCTGCNLVVVSLDTVRADHLGCYGHARDTMPATCAFFADGIRFAHAISQAPWTAPAHASMFTGRLPAAHGVVAGPTPAPLGDALPTLFSILRERGYATLAVHGGGYLRAALPAHALDVDVVIPLLRQGPAFEAIRSALEGAPDGRPFFLFVHAFDPHTHYKPRENHFAERDAALDRRAYGEGVCEFEDLPDGSRRLDPARIPRDPDDWRYIETLYDSEIYEADATLGRLWELLRDTGRLERTVVAFTSDHGEEFFDHGSCEHVK